MIIGTGYVGLTQGVCLAELGNEVRCIDRDRLKVEKLRRGISPIYEPGLDELLKKNLAAGRIVFDLEIEKYMDDNEIIFIAVGTPPDSDGNADLTQILDVAETIGKHLKKYQIIVNKSTVPVRTGYMVEKTIKKYYNGDFDIISNPEFLREGSAINDFMNPDRIILGHNNGNGGIKKLLKLYEVLNAPLFITDLNTAEMIKYASNSFLATEISFINSIAAICEKVGADVEDVAKGMRLDKRIGEKAFFNAGIGYGGSCFPKDVKALIHIAKNDNIDFKILEEVEKVNMLARQRFIEKIKNELGTLKNKKIAVWGLAFKPKTDDIREAPALSILKELFDCGAKIYAYDPAASLIFEKIMPKINYCKDSIDACRDAEALLILTEWDEFKQVDFEKIYKIIKQPVIFDGRNIYDPNEMIKHGFKYYAVGRLIKK